MRRGTNGRRGRVTHTHPAAEPLPSHYGSPQPPTHLEVDHVLGLGQFGGVVLAGDLEVVAHLRGRGPGGGGPGGAGGGGKRACARGRGRAGGKARGLPHGKKQVHSRGSGWC